MGSKQHDAEGDNASAALGERNAILMRSTLFRDMPAPLIRHVAANAIERRLRNGEVLFLKHDPDDFIALVVAGRVYSVLYGPDGRELIVNSANSGDVVGETALIDFRRRDTAAFACGPTRILVLRRRHFPELTAEPIFLNRLLALLCERLRDAVAFIESVCLHRLESRLARYFISVADSEGKTDANGTVVPLPPSQSILAAMVNASRPKLNAQLQVWRRSGLVNWTHDSLLIVDVDQLRSKAHAAVP